MFYAGDEYADDECTSGRLDWTEQFVIYDDIEGRAVDAEAPTGDDDTPCVR